MSLIHRVLNNVLKIIFHIIKIIGCFVIGLILLLVPMTYLIDQFTYVQLPNGIKLVKKGWGYDEIALLDADGKLIVLPKVMEIVWNQNFVAGRQLLHDKPIRSDGRVPSVYFIYRLGAANAIFYSEDESSNKYFKNLEDAKLLQLEDKTFWDLEKNPAYQRIGIN